MQRDAHTSIMEKLGVFQGGNNSNNIAIESFSLQIGTSFNDCMPDSINSACK